MSIQTPTDQKSIDDRKQRARSEPLEARVVAEGIVNVTNHSHDRPTTHSVFVDLLDGEAVSCSCPDWEHRKPAGGCKHLRFVRAREALVVAASTPHED